MENKKRAEELLRPFPFPNGSLKCGFVTKDSNSDSLVKHRICV